ncbi:Protein disulfide-isomerase 2 (PDI2) [Durusdinium trenchii]|uniref:protein disulfide-isomerase n=1 Tax=Durusdinium trenchii TaxID=1381693 RepID=A0ABP0NUS6_9DINO
MIKKMMTTLKKEKGLVDMNEVMGLRQAAEALKPDAPAGGDGGAVKKGKGGQLSDVREASEEMERKRQLRREELKKEEAKRKEIARKDKEKKKRRLEAEKLRKEKKKVEEEERRKVAAKLAEEKRRQREVERLRQVATPLFSWGQSKEQIRMSISIPGLQKDSVNVTLDADRITVYAADWQKRRYLLDFELRGFIEPSNSSWSEEETAGRLEGLLVTLRKSLVHRWDRLAQNHSAVKNFLRKDWVQDDGEVEEEQEEVELPSGPNVKKVSSSGVQRLLEKRSLVVLAPRFPWCDKCKEKDREFVKAAKGSRDVEHLDTVAFASMDAREEKHWARKYNVTCDDTCELLLFKSDEEEPYVVPGKRFSEELQVECYKHLLPVVSTINDRAQFERLKGAFDTAIIGFFRQEKSSDAWFPRFQQAARALRGHALFGAVFRGHTPSTMGIEWEGDWDSSGHETRPLVLLFKPKEERHVEFTGELTLEKLSHFSKVLSLPLLSPYTPESRQKYIELKVPLAMLWLDGEDEAHPASRAAREVAERLAHRFSGQLVFVTLNTTRDGFLLRPFGLDPRAPPLFGLASEESTEAQRFAWRQTGDHWLQPSFEGLESFCQAFLNGSLEASHESGVLPESYKWPGPGSVEEVVWTTFRSSVRESEHLLLELYSPYRPQHRTHLVVLDLVAEALAKLTTIKVARMDTANNYVLPEFALKDKEKSSSIFFRLGPQRWRRFAPKTARLEELPAQMLKFLHREMKGNFDLPERLAWVKEEAWKRIRRLKALEKDYEKKMQDEWMQKEIEEFERYKRLGKFDSLNL